MKVKKLLLVAGFIFFSSLSSVVWAQDFNIKQSIERGKSIYSANCASCHMINGEGITSVYPPLANMDSVALADKDRLVRIVVQGLSGPIEVKGVKYNGKSPGFKFTDQQVADILNYIRNSWGNEGEVVLPGEVQPALKTDKNETE